MSATEDAGSGPEPAKPWPLGRTFHRADKICAGLVGFIMVFGLVMLPLRPVLLTSVPLLLVALTGSRSGMVACGALAATGHMPWILPLAIGTASLVKFDVVFWWAGKLWGDDFIASLVTQTPRGRRRAKRAEEIARRFDVLAIGVTRIPYVPIPAPIIFAVLGTAGTTLQRFVVVDLAWSLLAQSGYLYLGYTIGEPAVQVLDEAAKYAWYLTIVLIVFVVWSTTRAARREQRPEANQP